MRKWPYIGAGTVLAACGIGFAFWIHGEAAEQRRYARNETEVLTANPARLRVRLFRAAGNLSSAQEVSGLPGSRISLGPGNFFVRAEHSKGTLLYPVSILGYNGGPNAMDRFSSRFVLRRSGSRRSSLAHRNLSSYPVGTS